ncbi:MAG: outer membrane protein assembly factor BamB [Candidatus Pelagisphaera sp.]|jgi:outer membrane protein assembly factor BamB
MCIHNRFTTSLIILFGLIVSGRSADVTSWRNGGNGLYPNARPPLQWDDPSNILWKIDTPVWGNACPVLIGDRLIFTAEPADLICIDSKTGKLLWKTSNAYEDVITFTPDERQTFEHAKSQELVINAKLAPFKAAEYKLNRRVQRDKENIELKKELRALRKQMADIRSQIDPILLQFKKPKTHDTNGYASLTPCSDGEFIYNCNGLGIVTKHDLEGNRIWAKTMERPDHNWGASISPQIVDNKLIVRISDYAALDLETGEELWRIEDPHTFGPPAIFSVENHSYLYTTRGELIRVSDGTKLPSQDWTIEQKTFAFFNTNFVSGNRIYAAHGAAGIQGDVFCMEFPDTIQELEQNGLKQIWHADVSKERYYASPLVHEGLVYIFSMGQVFQVLDAANGELAYSKKIPGRMERTFPGLLLVNDMIYTGEENGTAFFLKPGREYQEIARFNIGECRSTPIFNGDTVYLRSMEHVYAFKANSN